MQTRKAQPGVGQRPKATGAPTASLESRKAIPSLGLLDTAFFSDACDHFNQETGSVILSLAEQIGRTLALLEACETKQSEETLLRVLAHLEAVLANETAKVLPVAKQGHLRK